MKKTPHNRGVISMLNLKLAYADRTFSGHQMDLGAKHLDPRFRIKPSLRFISYQRDVSKMYPFFSTTKPLLKRDMDFPHPRKF